MASWVDSASGTARWAAPPRPRAWVGGRLDAGGVMRRAGAADRHPSSVLSRTGSEDRSPPTRRDAPGSGTVCASSLKSCRAVPWLQGDGATKDEIWPLVAASFKILQG